MARHKAAYHHDELCSADIKSFFEQANTLAFHGMIEDLIRKTEGCVGARTNNMYRYIVSGSSDINHEEVLALFRDFLLALYTHHDRLEELGTFEVRLIVGKEKHKKHILKTTYIVELREIAHSASHRTKLIGNTPIHFRFNTQPVDYHHENPYSFHLNPHVPMAAAASMAPAPLSPKKQKTRKQARAATPPARSPPRVSLPPRASTPTPLSAVASVFVPGAMPSAMHSAKPNATPKKGGTRRKRRHRK